MTRVAEQSFSQALGIYKNHSNRLIGVGAGKFGGQPAFEKAY